MRWSVLSRFRLAAAALMLGVVLVGAIFYGLIHSYYSGILAGRTLGGYTDTLAQRGFEDEDLDIWRRMAASHGVAIVVEPLGGPALAFDQSGRPVDPAELTRHKRQIRGVRTSPDGMRATFYWHLSPFAPTHRSLLVSLLLLLVGVMALAFWFLHRQLGPLAALQTGVEAVARGDLAARVPVARDDEIGRVAAAFNDMAGRVEQMVGARERLLADVSHELRSPIARMKVALELMPEGAKRDRVQRDLREMEELVAMLLERERMRSRDESLLEPVDLSALAGEIVAAHRERPPGVQLEASEGVCLSADPALIKLLVQNLVDNAIEFSHPDSRAVRVELEDRGDAVTLRVADDGIGIPAESAERVFEPFVKLDRARGHRRGYGLGLDLCRRIVELHGGTIRLAPNEPRGTIAVVVLPRRERRAL